MTFSVYIPAPPNTEVFLLIRQEVTVALPLLLMPAPAYLIVLFPVIVTLLSRMVLLSLYIPPPSTAVLSFIEPSSMASVPESTLIPPPWSAAVLPLISVSLTVRVFLSEFSFSPPPSVPELLPVIKQFVMLPSLARWTLSPPPSSSEWLSVICTPLSSSFPVYST